MNIFVYADESGVFDKYHNDIFAFAGVIFLDKDSRDICARKYLHAERDIRKAKGYEADFELKACLVSNKDKGKLHRSLNNEYKFGAVVNQRIIKDTIYQDKKTKQRYLDYAFKIGLKKCFERMIARSLIDANQVENIYIFCDQHTTATNGLYELKESLELEFKRGMHNYTYSTYYPPIFKNLKSVTVKYCDSCSNTLIRAADIVANRLYFEATNDEDINKCSRRYVTRLP